MNKAKLHELVESVKEDYLLNVIEESTNEIEVLRTKKFLNETSAIVEKMLLEGFDAVGAPAGAGAGAPGAGAGAGDGKNPTMLDNIKNYVKNQYNNAKTGLQNVATQYGKLPGYARYGIPGAAVAGMGAGAAAAFGGDENAEDLLSQLSPEQLQELMANIGG